MSTFEKDKVQAQRNMSVYKHNDMVQRGRFNLSLQAQRIVLYAISKIKPEDKVFSEYEFNIKEFYSLCGIENDSYTRLKYILGKIADSGWWFKMPDGMEHRLRWFSKIKLSEKSGKVIVRLDEDVMPFLLDVVNRNEYFTTFDLKYILPMSSKYSPRLYEILKSYSFNNVKWFFEVEQLKKLMCCENKRWPDFRRFVLDAAVEEINQYTDLAVSYYTENSGRKVEHVVFLFDKKTKGEKAYLDQEIEIALDGQLSMYEINDEVKARAAFTMERREAKKTFNGGKTDG